LQLPLELSKYMPDFYILNDGSSKKEWGSIF
jgi:hypothetical protein